MLAEMPKSPRVKGDIGRTRTLRYSSFTVAQESLLRLYGCNARYVGAGVKTGMGEQRRCLGELAANVFQARAEYRMRAMEWPCS